MFVLFLLCLTGHTEIELQVNEIQKKFTPLLRDAYIGV
jgi:hypothetical protein